MWCVAGAKSMFEMVIVSGILTHEPIFFRCYSHRGNAVFRELVLVRIVLPDSYVHQIQGNNLTLCIMVITDVSG
jgi:hypothetical protein